MPRLSDLVAQILDYNIGWGWRYALALYFNLTEPR